jgi:hypothetical protein
MLKEAEVQNNMVDIRDQVEDSRGVLKKLQLLIPGYSGYRKLEDIREADNYLRIQIANKMHENINSLQDLRKMLVDRGLYAGLSQFQTLFSEIQQLEGAIRHAQQGYSGISPPIRITADNLNAMYEYDYNFIAQADALNNEVKELVNAVMSGNSQDSYAKLQSVSTAIRDLRDKFNERMVIIQGIKV